MKKYLLIWLAFVAAVPLAFLLEETLQGRLTLAGSILALGLAVHFVIIAARQAEKRKREIREEHEAALRQIREDHEREMRLIQEAGHGRMSPANRVIRTTTTTTRLQGTPDEIAAQLSRVNEQMSRSVQASMREVTEQLSRVNEQVAASFNSVFRGVMNDLDRVVEEETEAEGPPTSRVIQAQLDEQERLQKETEKLRKACDEAPAMEPAPRSAWDRILDDDFE